LQLFLKSFTVHRIDEKVALLAGQHKKKYAKSHDLDLGDALIAATATIAGEELATLNTKHFPMLKAVRPY
jgi:predicted nucleic acid-binding protein